MQKKTIRFALIGILSFVLMISGGCSKEKQKTTALDPKNPVTITVWNYYNGDQLAAFEQLVEEFNSTIGKEKGIVVMNISHGDINTLADSLIASVRGEAGAQEKPELAAVYAETAYILNEANALAALDSYFTEEELSAYVAGFLEEGRFGAENELLLFPILKSTELFTANETDWAPFAEATGITLDSIKTNEDLTAAAQAYYEWTDSLTPEIKEDGKALYGRDSVANYIYVGSYQLGHELFQVKDGKMQLDLDHDTFKTLWDNFYIPYINGYFGSYARFRSEDCKTGKILALTSSSSSVGYLPVAVTKSDDTTYEIATYESKALPFASAVNNGVVQQGASYCLMKSTEAKQEGAVAFLKWFTEPERNLKFGLMSGYSPVTLTANTREKISEAYNGDTTTSKGQNVLNGLLLTADTFNENTPYAIKPFSGSKEVRAILGDFLENIAKTDRAAVLEKIASGESRAEAVAEYVNDAYFEAWFAQLCEQVQMAVK